MLRSQFKCLSSSTLLPGLANKVMLLAWKHRGKAEQAVTSWSSGLKRLVSARTTTL